MPNQKVPSFMSALRENVMLPGESLGDFSAQYKKLDPADKNQLYAWLIENGIPCEPPKQTT
jgi:hypothetical protein